MHFVLRHISSSFHRIKSRFSPKHLLSFLCAFSQNLLSLFFTNSILIISLASTLMFLDFGRSQWIVTTQRWWRKMSLSSRVSLSSPFELVQDEGAGGQYADQEKDCESPNTWTSGSSMVSWGYHKKDKSVKRPASCTSLHKRGERCFS